MKARRWPQGVLLLCWLAGAGCTALREIPRSEFAAHPERKHVRVTTRDGLVYEFDYAKVESDTLTGFRERPSEGAVSDWASLQFALDDIASLSVRGVDWYRTGLIGGGALAAVVAAGLTSASNSSSESGGGSGGGGGPRLP